VLFKFDLGVIPATTVFLTHQYWMGRTAITQMQWQAIMGNIPCHFQGYDFPAEHITWEDAMAFCQKLTERERAAQRLPNGYIYSLPSEAQREYASRSGTTDDHIEKLESVAWYNENSSDAMHPFGTTHSVATKLPNKWGFYDMQGNVMEWCRDYYDTYPGGNIINSNGPTGSCICSPC